MRHLGSRGALFFSSITSDDYMQHNQLKEEKRTETGGQKDRQKKKEEQPTGDENAGPSQQSIRSPQLSNAWRIPHQFEHWRSLRDYKDMTDGRCSEWSKRDTRRDESRISSLNLASSLKPRSYVPSTSRGGGISNPPDEFLVPPLGVCLKGRGWKCRVTR